MGIQRYALTVLILSLLWVMTPTARTWAETLTIAVSPEFAPPLKALGEAFESANPGVKVRLYYGSGIHLEQALRAKQIHLVAPGTNVWSDDGEAKRYQVLSKTLRPYAVVPIALAASASLPNPPSSLEDLGQMSGLRVVIIGDPATELGRRTQELLDHLGLRSAVQGRLETVRNTQGVLDHLSRGRADVGILFGPDAVQQIGRFQIIPVTPNGSHQPILLPLALDRFCPNAELGQAFLDFTLSPEAQAVLKRLGYDLPAGFLTAPTRQAALR
jgi:molybdate transport system substrate-binding protein